jgi:hypothetical protein
VSEPRGWTDNQSELSVEQLTLVECPVPGMLEQARALGQEGTDLVVQRGSWRGGAVGRGDGGPPGQEEAGTENEAGFGSGGAHD